MRFKFSHPVKIALTVLGLVIGSSAFAQGFHGYVREAGSMEPLIGATVYDSLSTARCYSNEFGYFSLNLTGQKPAIVKASFPGYTSYRLALLGLRTDSSTTIFLYPSTLEEVEISAEKRANPPLGLLTVGREKLLQTPSVGGVPDLLKVLGTLPGVSNGGEIFTGLLVRGGNDDQNLHLLDGAPVYGTTHLFNLVSFYNAEAIKKAQLYKGYFPARYGGRVSSVLDVNFREGSKKKLQGNWSLGILNSAVLLEGPIGKLKKSSFLIAGRATYLDLFTLKKKQAVNRQQNGYNTYNNFGFFDLNARFNHEFDPKNKLFLQIYYGDDHQKNIDQNILTGYQSNSFADLSQTNQTLKNLSVCMRYSNVRSDKLFAHYNISFNRYENNIKNLAQHYQYRDSLFRGNVVDEQYLKSQTQNYRLFSGENLAGRAEWVYAHNPHHQFRAGCEGIFHTLRPGDFTLAQQERADDGAVLFEANLVFGNPVSQHFETAAYLEDEISVLGKRLTLHPGVRLNHFSSSNQTTFDPRFAAEYRLPHGGQIAGAIGISTQFLHTLNGDANRIDKSIWVGSNKNFPAQKARIVTVGYSKNLLPLQSSCSIELFYRKMNGLTFFKFNPDDPKAYADWQSKLIGAGTGISYGADFLWSTTVKHFSATAAYSLSWNDRKFPLLNNGVTFPAKYDRRHDLKIAANFSPPKSKWSFGANWFFNTGHRYTIPVGFVAPSSIFGGFPAYDGINNVRMPNYHRLDLLARWTRTPSSGWIKEYSWSFDILNAYNRKNPYGLVLKTKTETGANGKPVTVKKLTGVALLPIMPSITFRVKF